MRTSSSVPGDGAIPELDEPRVRLVRGPPPGWSGDLVEVALRLAQEHDRIATGMNDVVVRRLFSAGLSLQTALALMDGHRAAGKVQEAIGELDLAIADFRSVLFGHHQPDAPLGGRGD
jgi:Histidine kinase